MTRGRGPYKGSEADLADLEQAVTAARAAGKLWAVPAPSPAPFELATKHDAAFVATCDALTALRSGLEQGLKVAKEARIS